MAMTRDENILVVCSDAGLREALAGRLSAPSSEDAEATNARVLAHPLDAVVALAEGGYRAMVFSAADVAGREEFFRSAVREVAPSVRLFVLCRPADEPLGRKWLAAGVEDYFIAPRGLDRLVSRLQQPSEVERVEELLGAGGHSVSLEDLEPMVSGRAGAGAAQDVAPIKAEAHEPPKAARRPKGRARKKPPTAPAKAEETPEARPAAADRRIIEAAVAIGRLAMGKPKVILSKGADIVLGAVGAERGSLLSWDAEAKRLSLEVAYGVPKELAAEMAGGEHAIAKIGARTGEPILVGIDDADVKHEHPERYKTGSFLCMPMSVDSEGGRRKTVGVICVTSKLGSEPISTDDLKVLEPLARELASVYAAALQRERFHEMAYTDYETGLGNLRFFSTYLKSLLEQARAQEGEVGLFLVKADHRIFVNNVAIRPSTREMQQIGRAMGDLSGAGVRVARLKENLFAVTLWRAPGTSRIESGDPFADFVLKIQAVVRERKLPLTVSVGYNVFPIYADDAMQLVAGAREALGRALPRGPGSVAGPR